LNPGNRFEGVRLHVLGEELDRDRAERPGGRQVSTEVLPDRTRTIINRVESPDVGFNWTVNPYRGCEHGCIYCYARPGHEMLGMSCGLDFETKIMAKHDAPALLRKELSRESWRGEPIIVSGVTDPYQPIEQELRITRGVLEVMAEFRQPVSLITKNRLITRDVDVLSDLARDSAAAAAVSITSLDNRLASNMEPRASAPRERLAAVSALAAAGVPVSVMVAPVVPGLNDEEIPAILKAASEAGASSAGWILLRLPWQIKALFLEWLARHYPERAGKVEGLIREARGGKLYDARPKVRFRGEGERAAQIGATFDVFARRYGLRGRRAGGGLSSAAFAERRARRGQMGLWGNDE
jgi:DNA repair photolyase